MDNNAIARATRQPTTWTNVPPALSGYQTQGASILPLGNYRMPDGSNQVSFGLPQTLLDAYRSMRYGAGYEQDPKAPQGFMSNNAIAAGANGLAAGAVTGTLPAAGAGVLLRGAVPNNQLNSGFMSGLRQSVKDAARSLTGAHNRVLQERIERAVPYRTVPPNAGNTGTRRAWLEQPRRTIEDMTEARLSVEEMAARVGETPETVAKYINRLDREGLLVSRRQDPLVARDNKDKFNEVRRQARMIDKATSKGQRAQESLDRRQGNRYEEEPQRLPPPQRQGSKDGGSLNSNEGSPFGTKQVEADPPAQQLPPPDKPKKPSNTVSQETKEKFWEAMETRADGGKSVPGKGSRKDFGVLRDELKEAGIEMTDAQIRKRLGILRDSGKEGPDQADWIRSTGPKGANRLPGAFTGVPKSPTEPDAGSDFDHVTESGVVKVGEWDDG